MKTIDIEGKGDPVMSSELVIKDHETGEVMDLNHIHKLKITAMDGSILLAEIKMICQVAEIKINGIGVSCVESRCLREI